MTGQSENTFEDKWMIRPCVVYLDEYKECSSIRGRFHQYFIFGEKLDCNPWKLDYERCQKWNNSKSEEAYKQLIESEKQRRFERLRGHYGNTVWTKREKPPEDWNKPLPDWMEKKYENSVLTILVEKENKSAHQQTCNIL